MSLSAYPLVSVVVPTYGRASRISRALDSVLSQSYANIEIIVVDDNDPSSDQRQESIAVLEKYINNEQVRIIYRDANGGGSAARNSGISAAKGEFITFLDDDDYYFTDKVARQVEHILSQGLDISLCHMEIHEGGMILDEDISYARGVTLEEFIVNGVAFTPMIMCRADVIRRIGGFHVTPRFQDHVLMILLLETDPKIAILDEKLFVHSRHSGPRVTYGANLEEAYRIRHTFERRNIARLSPMMRRKVNFRHSLVESRLVERRSGKAAGLMRWGAGLQYIQGPTDVVAAMKTLGRLFLKPETHF